MLTRRKTICGVNFNEFPQKRDNSGNCLLKNKVEFDFLEPSMLGIKPEPPKWPEREELIRASIQRRANSVDIPLSLRIIKEKQKKLNEGINYGDDSVKKVHSSMVFIILELQRHALKMRESILGDNSDGVIDHSRREMNDSFAWLFKQIFPKSPNMMICLMTLLADFSEYSLAKENISELNLVTIENNTSVENGVVDEITRIKDNLGSDLEIEQDNYVDYHRTDLQYQMNLSKDPNNSLIWCNYAQFLHVVSHDYDRAEDCFKRATSLTPPDAEALNRYANFLWVVRNDLAGAEKKYTAALDIESDNTYYASSYANFLWSTGGEDTCFPL